MKSVAIEGVRRPFSDHALGSDRSTVRHTVGVPGISAKSSELLGMACGLGLLFNIPLVIGACIAALDVILILLLQRKGVRYLEAVIVGLVAAIGACFAAQLWWLHPPIGADHRTHPLEYRDCASRDQFMGYLQTDQHPTLTS